MPLTDTHAHVWSVDGPGMGWLNENRFRAIRRDYSIADLLANMRVADVSDVVLVSSTTEVSESESLLEIGSQHPAIAGVVGWVPLSTPTETAAGLQRLTGNEKLVGLRYLDGWEPDHGVLVDGRARESLQLLDGLDLTLDVQVPFASALAACDAIASAAPNLTIVLDHMVSPVLHDRGAFDAWSRVVADLATRTNVFVKLSGWTTRHDDVPLALIRPFVDVLMARFGSRRLMMGSNWPVSSMRAGYRTTMAWTAELVDELSETEARCIGSETAVSVYRRDKR
ncbi:MULTISPECIES: amidohydrolase family protein [unclassified Nocardioides]|uniref:amidohydrolase family protein n=1 Tax=unclassified Nocardioides TaxID=2615069 RepID=UPI0000EB622F|nr:MULTISPECIES: amidohydrolase family protein [unclassified Nocardioides]ABL81653.1 amidohydrolase 2 [Nocardioides sp. JS614]